MTVHKLRAQWNKYDYLQDYMERKLNWSNVHKEILELKPEKTEQTTIKQILQRDFARHLNELISEGKETEERLIGFRKHAEQRFETGSKRDVLFDVLLNEKIELSLKEGRFSGLRAIEELIKERQEQVETQKSKKELKQEIAALKPIQSALGQEFLINIQEIRERPDLTPKQKATLITIERRKAERERILGPKNIGAIRKLELETKRELGIKIQPQLIERLEEAEIPLMDKLINFQIAIDKISLSPSERAQGRHRDIITSVTTERKIIKGDLGNVRALMRNIGKLTPAEIDDAALAYMENKDKIQKAAVIITEVSPAPISAIPSRNIQIPG